MQTYTPIRFNYNKITCTSSITILLKVPHIPEEDVTIILPFTEDAPALKYKLPPYIFRDEESVYESPRRHELIQLKGPTRCMPLGTIYAHQYEYDEWIYNAGFEERSGYIVWAAIKQYVDGLDYYEEQEGEGGEEGEGEGEEEQKLKWTNKKEEKDKEREKEREGEEGEVKKGIY
jgi:hypothetical protein